MRFVRGKGASGAFLVKSLTQDHGICYVMFSFSVSLCMFAHKRMLALWTFLDMEVCMFSKFTFIHVISDESSCFPL